MFVTISLIRKFLFIMLALYFGNYPGIQVHILIVTCLFMIIFINITKPFTDKRRNRIEKFNEGCCLLTSYLMLLFTNFNYDLDVLEICGWVMIGITLIN